MSPLGVPELRFYREFLGCVGASWYRDFCEYEEGLDPEVRPLGTSGLGSSLPALQI